MESCVCGLGAAEEVSFQRKRQRPGEETASPGQMKLCAVPCAALKRETERRSCFPVAERLPRGVVVGVVVVVVVAASAAALPLK